MKPAYGLLLLVFLLSFGVTRAQEENNSVLDKTITLEAMNSSIASILDSISTQSHIFFSYDPALIDASKITSLSISGKTIKETLDIVFEGRYLYKVLGDQIVISIPAEVAVIPEEQDSIQEKHRWIIFKGRVIDREEKDVLPYTNISILTKNIGTISNIDGDFELKIPESMQLDTVAFSCLGYLQYRLPIADIINMSYIIRLQPKTIQLKEIKVAGINAPDIITRILSKINLNYSRDPEIMTSFYREVLKQDDKYIDVAEAVLEIRKAAYDNSFAQDKVKYVKGRKNLNIKTFKFVDFKIQGGPYYITKVDVVKTLDSFLDPEFREFYKYSLDEIVEFDDRETYVVEFKPREKIDYPCYQGKLYVDMSTFALVQAEFSLSRAGLKFAHESLIKKKPKDFYVRPIDVNYKVSYRRANNKWHLSSAQASIDFRVKSKQEKINSVFHSVSDLVITDFQPDNGTHFRHDELFSPKDIFTEKISNNDADFWDNYNTIKPSEDLLKALQTYYLENDTLFNDNKSNEKIITNK